MRVVQTHIYYVKVGTTDNDLKVDEAKSLIVNHLSLLYGDHVDINKPIELVSAKTERVEEV